MEVSRMDGMPKLLFEFNSNPDYSNVVKIYDDSTYTTEHLLHDEVQTDHIRNRLKIVGSTVYYMHPDQTKWQKAKDYETAFTKPIIDWHNRWVTEQIEQAMQDD